MKFKKITADFAQRVRKDIQLWYTDSWEKYPVCNGSPEDWRDIGDIKAVDTYFSIPGREWYIQLDEDKPEYVVDAYS